MEYRVNIQAWHYNTTGVKGFMKTKQVVKDYLTQSKFSNNNTHARQLTKLSSNGGSRKINTSIEKFNFPSSVNQIIDRAMEALDKLANMYKVKASGTFKGGRGVTYTISNGNGTMENHSHSAISDGDGGRKEKSVA